MQRTFARLAGLLCCLNLALAVIGFAPVARAQDAPSEEIQAEARARLREGVKAYEAKRYKDAVDAFLAANRLVPNPGLSFNTAKAYEKLGDAAGALSFFRDYLRRAPDASDRAEVERKIKKLEQRVQAKGLMQLTILSVPLGGTVVLDGQPVGVTPWTGEIAPGEHGFRIKLEGYRDHEQTFELPRDHALDLNVQLESAPPEAAAQPARTQQATESYPAPLSPQASGEAVGSRRVSVPTWAVLGAGTAALGTALGFELARRSAESDAEDATTQLEAIEHYETMQGRRDAARIIAGVGGAALLTGAVLLYFDLSSKKDGASSEPRAMLSRPGIAVGCAPGGLVARGRF
ncbi:MAG TPA: PEGA domain-containing protein [Polyangiaceae bacterium]|nr:PEGA domain-containing protein [Polyangiaceae bacterium]